MAEEKPGNRNIILIAAVIAGASASSSAAICSATGCRRARMADRAVTVRGLAERDVTANLATWTINFNAQGTELGAVQAEIDRDARTVAELLPRGRLSGRGASPTRGGSVNQYFDNNRGENSVTVNRRLQLRTDDVMRARRAYARQFELIRNGVAIQEGSDMSICLHPAQRRSSRR